MNPRILLGNGTCRNIAMCHMLEKEAEMAAQPTKDSAGAWLAEHWPKATLFLAIYTFGILYLYLYQENRLLFLLWVQTPIYWLHQFEEYVYPGGFADFFNRKLLQSDQTDWPVTKIFSFWINIPIIFIAFPLSAALWVFTPSTPFLLKARYLWRLMWPGC